MTLLNRIAAEGQARLHVVREGRDRGQGTLEYVGIAVLIGLIMTALFASNIDTQIKDKLVEAFNTITTRGGA